MIFGIRKEIVIGLFLLLLFTVYLVWPDHAVPERKATQQQTNKAKQQSNSTEREVKTPVTTNVVNPFASNTANWPAKSKEVKSTTLKKDNRTSNIKSGEPGLASSDTVEGIEYEDEYGLPEPIENKTVDKNHWSQWRKADVRTYEDLGFPPGPGSMSDGDL